jgi:type I restriction enzyme M protein
MEEIEQNDFNLNISRYVSTAEAEPDIDLAAVNAQLIEISKRVEQYSEAHNAFLRQLGLPSIPS